MYRGMKQKQRYVTLVCQNRPYIYIYIYIERERCARGVMVIVVGNGHDDTTSNPGPDWLHFT